MFVLEFLSHAKGTVTRDRDNCIGTELLVKYRNFNKIQKLISFINFNSLGFAFDVHVRLQKKNVNVINSPGQCFLILSRYWQLH